jgi:hypothetical protein
MKQAITLMSKRNLIERLRADFIPVPSPGTLGEGQGERFLICKANCIA